MIRHTLVPFFSAKSAVGFSLEALSCTVLEKGLCAYTFFPITRGFCMGSKSNLRLKRYIGRGLFFFSPKIGGRILFFSVVASGSQFTPACRHTLSSPACRHWLFQVSVFATSAVSLCRFGPHRVIQ